MYYNKTDRIFLRIGSCDGFVNLFINCSDIMMNCGDTLRHNTGSESRNDRETSSHFFFFFFYEILRSLFSENGILSYVLLYSLWSIRLFILYRRILRFLALKCLRTYVTHFEIAVTWALRICFHTRTII